MDLEADHTAVVPVIDQELVDNNAAAPAASVNAGIEHTSAPYTMDPDHPPR